MYLGVYIPYEMNVETNTDSTNAVLRYSSHIHLNIRVTGVVWVCETNEVA